MAANNPIEQLLAVFWMLAGGIVWGFVIATLLNIANNSDPAQFEFRQAIEELNGFMRTHDLPPELRMMLREYFYESKFLTTHRNQMALIQNLSPKLLEETAVRSYVDKSPLAKLSFLKGVEKGFLAQVWGARLYPTDLYPASRLHPVSTPDLHPHSHLPCRMNAESHAASSHHAPSLPPPALSASRLHRWGSLSITWSTHRPSGCQRARCTSSCEAACGTWAMSSARI